MFKSKLEKYIAKRTLILIIVLAVMDLIFIGQRWMVLLGLIIGGVFSLLKFSLTASLLPKILLKYAKVDVISRTILMFVFNQILAVLILIISLQLSKALFVGMACGIFVVPFVIFLVSITGGRGLLRNNLE